jgi:hypothetical protein
MGRPAVPRAPGGSDGSGPVRDRVRHTGAGRPPDGRSPQMVDRVVVVVVTVVIREEHA